MKLVESYVETWEDRYKIYIIYGSGAVIILDGDHSNRFIAALSSIEEARDFIAGWPKSDCEGNVWRMSDGEVTKSE